MQVLLCRVGDCPCALPLERVIETMRVLPIEPIATSAAWVMGMAVIRGQPLPVVDLARLVGGDQVPTRLVTMRTGERLVALAVGAVEGVVSLDEARLGPLPPLLESPALSAVGIHDQQLLLVLEHAHLVPEGVWDELSWSPR